MDDKNNEAGGLARKIITRSEFNRLMDMVWSTDRESIVLAVTMIDELDEIHNRLYLLVLRNILMKRSINKVMQGIKFKQGGLISTRPTVYGGIRNPTFRQVLKPHQIVRKLAELLTEYAYDEEQTNWAKGCIAYTISQHLQDEYGQAAANIIKLSIRL